MVVIRSPPPQLVPFKLHRFGQQRPDDFDVLAENALKDACGFTNPKQASHAEIVAIFRAAMWRARRCQDRRAALFIG
ncbi:hypothetical protein [Aeromonas sanarellii]